MLTGRRKEPSRLILRSLLPLVILSGLIGRPAIASDSGIGEGASAPFALYLGPGFADGAGRGLGESVSPPFSLYLGPGFSPVSSGIGEQLSAPFPLYLGPGFGAPGANSIGSGISSAFALYLGPQFSPPAANGVTAAASTAFVLYLGTLSEHFALSAPFLLDTRLSPAMVGTIRASGGGPVAGATVELYLGSTRQQATTTDGAGQFEFFATIQGDYVLRAFKDGYSMVTSDLLRFRGSTLTSTIALGASPSQGRPDLLVGSTDLTYTVVNNGSLTLTAMVHNSGGQPASNVHVRFYDASTGSGINDFTRITPDATIASLAPGEAKPASVSWTPPSGHQRFYAFADPDHQIAESTELNNGSGRDLGASGLGRQPPRVASVTAKYDGVRDPNVFGYYLTGVHGATNVFTAQVTSDDDDVVEVDFVFDGQLVRDTDGSDGWSVPFDVGTLRAGNPTVSVTAKSAAGLRSEAWVGVFVVRAWPAWMADNLDFDGGTDGVSLTRDYLTIHATLSNKGLPGLPVAHFADVADNGVVIVGATHSTVDLDVTFEIGVPLDQTLPWKVSGSLSAREKLFDKPLDSANGSLSAEIAPDGSGLSRIQMGLSAQLPPFAFKERSYPIGSYAGVTFSVGLGLEARLNLMLSAMAQDNFNSYELDFSPELNAQITGSLTASVVVAKAQLIIRPNLRLAPKIVYVSPPGDMSLSGRFDMKIHTELVGTVGVWKFSASKTFLSKDFGPWGWSYPRSGASLELMPSPALAAVDSTIPSVFQPDPTAVAGPTGDLGLVWVADTDPATDHENPEVFFSRRDSLGNWSPQEQITSNDRYESTPTIAWLHDGRVLAVWTQSSLLESEVTDALTMSQALDRQDLWYAVRGTSGSWGAPQPLIEDAAQSYHADGLPTVAAGDSGAMAIWVRCLGDSALAPGGSELFSSRFDGTAWTPPLRVTTDTRDDTEPSIAARGAGRFAAAWVVQDPVDAGVRTPAWSEWDGSAWGAIRPVRATAWGPHWPSLGRAPDGRTIAGWVEQETRPDSVMIYHLMSAALAPGDSAWSDVAEAAADSHFVERPVCRVDQRGIAALVWRGYDGSDGDIKVCLRDLSRSGSPWSSPRAITGDTLTDWMATAAIDGQNNLHVIDLKSDLDAPAGAAQPAGNFLAGLTLSSRGIRRDLGVSDELNFGYRPLSCDLQLTAGSIELDRANPAAGESVLVRAAVANIGDVISGASQVRFYDGAPDSAGVPLPAGTIPLGPIEPDSSRTVTAIWVTAPGVHHLYAVADPGNVLAEQTESNNRAFLAVGVTPDLVVDSLAISAPDPGPGIADSIRAYVRNAGGGAASGFSLALSRRGAEVARLTGLALAPGEARVWTLGFTTNVGVDTLEVVADPDSVVPDPRRVDDRASIELRVLPDLVVPQDSIAYVAHDSSGTLSARVSNAGAVESGAFKLVFSAGNPLAGGVPIDSVSVDSLGPLASIRVAVPWRAPLGATTVYVVADPSGLIAERDRTNDEAYADVVTSALADLAIVAGSLQAQVAPAPPITLSARVTNLGAAHALQVGVEFFRGDPDSGGTLIADRLLATISAGETTAVTVAWPDPDPVSNPVYVVVDRADSIPEITKANNRANRTFGAVVGVPQVAAIPVRLALHPAQPNPFGSVTTIAYDLPKSGLVRLDVYDVAGRRVRSLIRGPVTAGFHRVVWNGIDEAGNPVRSGEYFVRLQAPGGSVNRKLVRLR